MKHVWIFPCAPPPIGLLHLVISLSYFMSSHLISNIISNSASVWLSFQNLSLLVSYVHHVWKDHWASFPPTFGFCCLPALLTEFAVLWWDLWCIDCTQKGNCQRKGRQMQVQFKVFTKRPVTRSKSVSNNVVLNRSGDLQTALGESRSKNKKT